MKIQKALPELVFNNIISQETANDIENYYKLKRKTSSTNQLLLSFGIIGATLLGLGIIAIIAHNWDELNKWTKLGCAILPLIITQLCCGFTLIKKSNHKTLRESSAVFLLFSIVACLAMISQIYNIEGDYNEFVLLWMLLSLPVIYVMQSYAASILYMIYITPYGTYHDELNINCYIELLILFIPFYMYLSKKRKTKQIGNIHHWLIPISITVVYLTSLDYFSRTSFEFYVIHYSGICTIMYLIGNLNFFKEQKYIYNGYKILGSIGALITLYILSVKDMGMVKWWFGKEPEIDYIQIYFLIGLYIIMYFITMNNNTDKILHKIKPLAIVFPLTLLSFTTKDNSHLIANIGILSIGILTIVQGALKKHLSKMNLGIFIILMWISKKFLDENIDFITKGILFIVLGSCFFIANYIMSRNIQTKNV